MSLGGDFYALTDNQLSRVLDGRLDYSKFLFDELPNEQPRECLGDFEPLWLALCNVLEEEKACGIEQTDQIYLMCSYCFANDVARIAPLLGVLTESVIQERCEQREVEGDPQEVWEAVQALTQFYQRAAQNADAVLLRVA